ncbi:Formylglycine-generating enzyme, required for sulfatase activity, contains SUMF1/FGE domain [Cribrihabitans marinus]|uniref:Formylglycine-generating enzyme, required for sulfatase activity, contains SUMF1/FGE domain n=1 Tax=Cribrihabitans marinus TaxID=1227549 RepID=A0A1H6U0B9_9RHOB|nr:SUMF1/EgtB/PvdO family nonheme iron enzyme [Cribrihabitans marinus]GGH21282.1 hypothetical protein GCM10010973_05780 [Cribrihabitans marinus]SEI83934.1 Formylglycine-generating enzyme, required for sulfatase activity, contains SUMF1/FGE domain [Cribrihabitans marinus]
MRNLVLLLIGLAGPALAQVPDWPVEQYDPAGAEAPADLVLPMPCGGGMAFQKVSVPMDATDPLADRRIRLGQSGEETGYSDYLRTTFLSGPFSDEPEARHYYIARYELTRGQYRALQGDCDPPERADRIARGGLSWHDAVTLARNYTGWLYSNAPEALPRAGETPGFVRLPTGDEWEYAARGGARADPAGFAAPRYFVDGELRDHALFHGGGGRGRLGPVGLRLPNPLGLFDVYGNAEELVLDPFRINALGRPHGQAGGVVTRGGSVLSSAAEIGSARRTEYPPYAPETGRPLRGDTFGLRLVIGAHLATSEARLGAIRDRWQDLARADPVDESDPEATLAALIEAEPDPRRQAALAALQLELRRNRDRVQTALQQSARATLLAGAAFVQTLSRNARAIEGKAASIRLLVELQRAGDDSPMLRRQLAAHVTEIEAMRDQQRVQLTSYRAALDALVGDVPPEDRVRAARVLEEELSLSRQVDLGGALRRFVADLETYAESPDMPADILLETALD